MLYKMLFNCYEEVDFFPDLSFLFFTICALFMIKKEYKTAEDIKTKKEEKQKDKKIFKNETELKNIIKFNSNSFYKTYSFLLKDILKAPNIKRIDSDSTIASSDSEMPIFQDMLNPKRRCYSADDIDSLNLITDTRIKDAFKKALIEKKCNTPNSSYTQISEDTFSSWDNLSIYE
jgi:hypothetical protein